MTAIQGEDINVDDSSRHRIMRAIRFFERVAARELFDAMDVADDERNAYTQTLHRLVKTGDIQRFGMKPFEYALRTLRPGGPEYG